MGKDLFKQAREISNAVQDNMTAEQIIDLGIRNGSLALKVLQAEVCDGDESKGTLAADYTVCRTNERLAEVTARAYGGPKC